MWRYVNDFKRRRLQNQEDKSPADHSGVTLTNGCRIEGLDPGKIRAIQRELTFYQPNAFEGSSTAPPVPVVAYRIDESGAIIVPRCFGITHFDASTDTLTIGSPLNAECEFRGVLLDRQVPAFDASVKALSASPHAAMLVLPCGFGKTVVSLAVAAAIGRRTMIVVHKEFLLEQWKERLGQFLPGATVGIVQGSKCETEKDFVIAMVQSLASRGYDDGTFDAIGTVLIDEAHHMAARLFSEIFFRLPAKHVLGLTATPKRKDGCTSILHLHMGAFAYQEDDLHNSATVIQVQYPTPWGARKDDELTPPEAQKLKTKVTRDSKRNGVIMDWIIKATDKGRRVIVLSDRVAHLEDLLRNFKTARPDMSSALYIGGMKRAARDEASKCTAIFGTFSLAQEGLDIPELDTLVLATPASDVTQAVGRVLRSSPNKASPLIIDVQDDCCRNFTRLNDIRACLYKKRGFDVCSGIDQAVL